MCRGILVTMQKKIPPKIKRVLKSFRVRQDHHEFLVVESKRRGVTQADLIDDALTLLIDRSVVMNSK